eukprot:gene8484-10078_t
MDHDMDEDELLWMMEQSQPTNASQQKISTETRSKRAAEEVPSVPVGHDPDEDELLWMMEQSQQMDASQAPRKVDSVFERAASQHAGETRAKKPENEGDEEDELLLMMEQSQQPDASQKLNEIGRRANKAATGASNFVAGDNANVEDDEDELLWMMEQSQLGRGGRTAAGFVSEEVSNPSGQAKANILDEDQEEEDLMGWLLQSSEDAEMSNSDKRAGEPNGSNSARESLLSEPIDDMLDRIEEKRFQQVTKESEDIQARLAQRPVSSLEQKLANRKREKQLWVDKYSPKAFNELLSDDRTNREAGPFAFLSS